MIRLTSPQFRSKSTSSPPALPADGEDGSGTSKAADRRDEDAARASVRLGPALRSLWPIGTSRPHGRPWRSRSD